MALPLKSEPLKSEEPSVALKALRGATWSLVMMSAMLNIIYLTGSFFMLEVYDRVIPSTWNHRGRAIYGPGCFGPDTQSHL